MIVRSYPTREGLPVSPFEVFLPTSHLNPESRANWNNHHLCHSAHTMGRFVVLQTLRDLDAMQFPMLKDLHNFGSPSLHSMYDQPHIDYEAAYRRVHEAFEKREPLRYGALHEPHYSVIGRGLLNTIELERQMVIIPV